jgi:two-component system chemotaxis sensor kinase CheA
VTETREEMLAHLRGIFAVEADEHLRAMNRHLLALEQGLAGQAREAALAEVFREAHSLKGAARGVNLPEVEGQAHKLEDLFAQMQDGSVLPGPGTIQEAYTTLDVIERLLRSPAHDGDQGSAAGAGDEAGTPEGPAPRPGGGEETIRVATAKLDALMADVGELLAARVGAEQRVADARALENVLAAWDSEWRRFARPGSRRGDGEAAAEALRRVGDRLRAVRSAVEGLRHALEADTRRMAQVTGDLQDDVRMSRMLPIATVFEAFPRMVRDLARDRGREVELTLRGGDTEVDRSVLEQVKDPITHLLRNCVDHGVEPAELRLAAGKPRAATIALSARQRGDVLIIEVADDGAGIDVEGIRAAATRKGLIPAGRVEELSEREAISMVFRSGFSTSPIITDLSGRGVGLDVVGEAVARLRGSVEVETRSGEGTTFTLSLPLSVSTVSCLLMEVGGEVFALPARAVERVLRVSGDDVERAQGREAIRIGDEPVVLARLADVLGLGPAARALEPGRRQPVVVIETGERRVAFLVDRTAQMQEVVVKTLPEPLYRVRHLAGATIQGSGRGALILNAAELVASVDRATWTSIAGSADERPSPTILVVEDAITTRTLERNILEAAGYRVQVAADGAEAWALLESQRCDLVVSDVEMPHMDGFELTAKVRGDQRLRDLPMVLVTSRESREDRERGIQVGADAYIVKGGFDQESLLETIRRLV